MELVTWGTRGRVQLEKIWGGCSREGRCDVEVQGGHPVPSGNGCSKHNPGPAKGPEADPRSFPDCSPCPRWCGINNKHVVSGMQFFLSFPWNRAAPELCYHLLQGPMVYSLPFSSRLQKCVHLAWSAEHS